MKNMHFFFFTHCKTAFIPQNLNYETINSILKLFYASFYIFNVLCYFLAFLGQFLLVFMTFYDFFNIFFLHTFHTFNF